MRARQRAPSQCNVHLQSRLFPPPPFFFLFLFLHETNNLPKGKNYSRKGKKKKRKKTEARRNKEHVTVTSLPILVDPGTATAVCIFLSSPSGEIWGVLCKNKRLYPGNNDILMPFFCTLHIYFFLTRGTIAMEPTAFFFFFFP